METVTIGIADMDEMKRSLMAAFDRKRQGSFITFPTVAAMMETLTPKRWEIIQAMASQEPMSIRAVGRLVGRDVKAVHGDVQALILAGVLDKGDGGQVVFPYDAIHVDFTIGKAA